MIACLRFFLLVFFLISNFSCVLALSYNELRTYMIAADVESIIAAVEEKPKRPLNLDEDTAELYLMSYLIIGDLEPAEEKINYYIQKYPKASSIKDLKKNLLFFKGDFKTAEEYKLNPEEKQHYKIKKLLDEYQVDMSLYKIKNPGLINEVFITNEKLDAGLRRKRKQVKKEALKLNQALPYFKTKLDYLLELKDPEINTEVEKAALDLISKKRGELFLKSTDYYELAQAYKALAILSITANDEKAAKRFIILGKENIYKMRSIWLIEDFSYEKKLMKTTERVTRFGYIIPQWLVGLREEFDSYLQ